MIEWTKPDYDLVKVLQEEIDQGGTCLYGMKPTKKTAHAGHVLIAGCTIAQWIPIGNSPVLEGVYIVREARHPKSPHYSRWEKGLWYVCAGTAAQAEKNISVSSWAASGKVDAWWSERQIAIPPKALIEKASTSIIGDECADLDGWIPWVPTDTSVCPTKAAWQKIIIKRRDGMEMRRVSGGTCNWGLIPNISSHEIIGYRYDI